MRGTFVLEYVILVTPACYPPMKGFSARVARATVSKAQWATSGACGKWKWEPSASAALRLAGGAVGRGVHVRGNSSDATTGSGAQSVFEMLHEDGGPTDKQIRFAESLAAEHGVQIPQAALASKQACSAFIEKCQGMSRSSGSSTAGVLVPTEKQLNYARKLAVEHGLRIPPDAMASRRACSDFIDSIPPTKKQAEFAKALAERGGLSMPPEVLKRRKSCSEFIDACQQGSLSSNAANHAPWAGGGYAESREVDGALDAETLAVLRELAMEARPSRPSLFQLLNGVLIAQQRALGIPAAALQDIRIMGKFIQDSSELPQAAVASMPTAGAAAGTAAAATAAGAAVHATVDSLGEKAVAGLQGMEQEPESEGMLRDVQVFDVDEGAAVEDCESKVLEIVFSLCADDSDSSKGASVADVQTYLGDQYDIHTDLHTVHGWLNSLVDRGLLESSEDSDIFWPPLLDESLDS